MTTAFTIINIIKLVLLIPFGVFLFGFRHKMWAAYLRLSFACALCLLNIIQLPIEIMLERIFILTIIVIILWGADAFLFWREIQNKKRLRKFWQEHEAEMKEMEEKLNLHIDSSLKKP